jgi:hypothetical protein
MKIQQQIVVLEKKLAQARKNLKLFNSGESNTLSRATRTRPGFSCMILAVRHLRHRKMGKYT